jgi:hypothetical protein
LRALSRPFQASEFEPAFAELASVPRTVTWRVHLLALRLRLVSAAQRPPATRPDVARSTVNVTFAALSTLLPDAPAPPGRDACAVARRCRAPSRPGAEARRR